MARLSLHADQRGAVYVEFLLAFPPLFLLFLGICQLCLVATAKVVVQHAANRAARTAIVVLEDDPDFYGGAARGSLSGGSWKPGSALEDLFVGLGVAPVSAVADGAFWGVVSQAVESVAGTQRGARMRPIRNAAYQPLLTLAPRDGGRNAGRSLAEGLPDDLSARLVDALAYTRGAAVVTVQEAPGSANLARDVQPKAPVTVRVTYFYHCAVPVVRALVCRSLARLLQESFTAADGGARRDRILKLQDRFAEAEDPRGLLRLAGDSFFTVLEAETTLPNQGAAYYRSGGR